MGLEILLRDEAATMALGERLGRLLGPGDVVLLIGPLGAGKSVLARGLARGLGVDKRYPITSPSFTLLNTYPGRVSFYHADLYRLQEEEVEELGLMEVSADGVLAVEWAERAAGVWPREAIVVRLVVEQDQSRRALVEGPEEILSQLTGEQPWG